MDGLGWRGIVVLVFTVMLSGRAMTLAYVLDAGGTQPGDPPAAWLMPLVGDAVVGVSALAVVALLLWGRGLGALLGIVSWNVVGIWDAMSAFLVHLSAPWPDFFMVQIFGWTMFFAASAMHAVCLGLVLSVPLRRRWLPGLD
ncbi:MAG: hypothetical protein KTR31_26585 [Myxococcales bacterium]|nr:hypothetical protein [Myxococcales bacterium]